MKSLSQVHQGLVRDNSFWRISAQSIIYSDSSLSGSFPPPGSLFLFLLPMPPITGSFTFPAPGIPGKPGGPMGPAAPFVPDGPDGPAGPAEPAGPTGAAGTGRPGAPAWPR